MKTKKMICVACCVMMILFSASLFSQENSVIVQELGGSATEVAASLIEQIPMGWGTSSIRYIDIAQFNYQGYQLPLGQIWARLLTDSFINIEDTTIRVLAEGGSSRQAPTIRISGEIFVIGEIITIHTDLISFEDLSILGSVRKEFIKTPEIAQLLFSEESGGGSVLADIYEPDSRESGLEFSLSTGNVRRTLTENDEDWFIVDIEHADAVRIFTTGDLDTYMTLYAYEM